MSRAWARRLAAVREALLTGDAAQAVRAMDDLVALVAREGIAPDSRGEVEAALAELRVLAEAALTGARQAAEQVRAIVLAARSLETYDESGRRMVTQVGTPAPRRY